MIDAGSLAGLCNGEVTERVRGRNVSKVGRREGGAGNAGGADPPPGRWGRFVT